MAPQNLLNELSDQVIIDTVGALAYQRGRTYARAGQVADLSVDRAKGTLYATVHGTARTPYQTLVTLSGDPRDAALAEGTCTCPVGMDCKHAAAVLVAARDQAAARGDGVRRATAWERSLAELMGRPAEEEAASGAPIALRFEVTHTANRTPSHRVPRGPAMPGTRVRLWPVVPGKRGNWVRTGVSWQDLQYDFRRDPHVEAHRKALRELYAAYHQSPYSYYGYAGKDLYLDEFGDSLWRLLDRAAEAGVDFVPTKASDGPVRLSPMPATLALDLTHVDGDAVSATPTVTVGGVQMSAASVEFLGDPVHGVFLEAATPTGTSLVLAKLQEPPTEAVSRLLSTERPIEIPEPDLDRFLAEFYPKLRQVITVRSSDESVSLPQVLPPRLLLTAIYGDEHQVTLDWSFTYTVDGETEYVPVSGDDEPSSVRDRNAERRLLAGLELPGERLPQLFASGAGVRTPVSRIQLDGIDTVFLTEDVLPRLRESDDVDVVIVGTAPDYRHTEARPLVQVSATESDDPDWFDLGVTVSVDGEQIPFTTLFMALANSESHLILDSGTYFSITRPEFEQLRLLIEEARGLQDREPDQLRISPYQAGLWDELTQLGVVEAQSERWARTVKGLLNLEQVTAPPLPDTLAAQLRSYQLEGYHWLEFLREHRLGGILADDMGLGKTVQTLAMVCRAIEAGQAEAPFLVVAPTSVVHNWVQEAARFAPNLAVAAVRETEGRRGSGLAELVDGADVVVTSYALFRLEYERYDAISWSGLILDEAQCVKNHQAKAYQCVRRLPAPFKLAVTGTPMENNLMELWALLSIVAPGLYPSPERFSQRYRKPIEKGGDAELLGTLRRRIRPLMLRRSKEQVAAELPPKQEQVLDVDLNPRHREIYQRHLQRERQKILGLVQDMDKNRFAIFRSLTLLRQLALDPALIDDEYASVRSSKTDAFVDQLGAVVGEGHRALVFSQFTGYLGAIRRRLEQEQIDYCYLDGRTRDRGRQIEAFKRGDAPVFLISLKAGGFGLNLTEADYCFVLDPWWNPAVESQAIDRTHRIGQDKTVMVYRMVASDTIEQKVMELQDRKRDLFARVMDDDALMSSPLTTEDIKSLIGA